MPLQSARRGFVLVWTTLLAGFMCSTSGAAPQTTSSPADTTTDPQVQRYLIRGTTEAQLGDYKEAILYFENALDQTPKTPTLLGALADAHAARSELATALFYARKARNHGRKRPYCHHRLAELQQEADQPQAALQTYQNLVARFPDERRAYRALAALQADLGQPEAALTTYRSLLNHFDRPSTLVFRRMLALYRQTGNVQGVEETLRTLTEHRPNNPTYRRRLGEHYAAEGRAEAALNLLAPLAEQHPSDSALQRQVRQLSQEFGHRRDSGSGNSTSTPANDQSVKQLVNRAQSMHEDALSSAAPPDSTLLKRSKELLRTALDRDPDHIAGMSLLARTHRQLDDPRAAGQILEKTLGENPRDPDRWSRAASAYLQANEYKKATAVSDEGLLLFPGHASLAQTAAFARLRSGDPGRAIDHFRTALDRLDSGTSTPAKTARLHAGLGLAYTKLDRPTEADEAFKTAQALAPNHPEVLCVRAYSLALRKEHLDRALDLAQRALKQSPGTPPLFLDTLGWVRFHQGDLEAARRHLRRALDAGPPAARVLEHFGDVQKALGNDTAAQEYWQKALDRAPNRSSLRKKLDEGSTS